MVAPQVTRRPTTATGPPPAGAGAAVVRLETALLLDPAPLPHPVPGGVQEGRPLLAAQAGGDGGRRLAGPDPPGGRVPDDAGRPRGGPGRRRARGPGSAGRRGRGANRRAPRSRSAGRAGE